MAGEPPSAGATDPHTSTSRKGHHNRNGAAHDNWAPQNAPRASIKRRAKRRPVDEDPPVDGKRQARDPGRVPGREERDGCRDVVGLADPPERVHLGEAVERVVAPRPRGRPHRAGGDEVDPDPARGRVHGQRAGQRGEARLGGAVGVVAEVHVAVDGADADDRPAPARLREQRKRRAGAAHGPGEGDLQVLVPLRVGEVLEPRGVHMAGVGVVDEHVEPPEALGGVRHRGVHRGLVDDVALHRRGPAAGLLGEGPRRRVGVLPVQVGQQDVRALGHQTPGCRPADALGPSGDDGRVSLEPAHGVIPRRRVIYEALTSRLLTRA